MNSRTLLRTALATAAALLAMPAASHAAFSESDFDDDGVPNEADNCLIVANPGQEPGATGPDGAACSGENQRSTITALRFAYTAVQLETIYESLDPGLMPGYDVKSRGWVRCQFGVRCLGFDQNREANTLINDPIVPILWRGQWFFTDADGGYLLNRTLNDTQQTLRGEVAYGESMMGGPAIVITYLSKYNPFPIDHIILECRTIQTGILDCYAWEHIELGPLGDRFLLLFNVFQDTTNPEL
jgi:uncharacterized membrane protein